MERETTCCFTGHRPDKLPWGVDETHPDCLAIKRRLQDALQRAYAAGFRHFICGMARGADLYFADAVLHLKQRYADVTLESARPCETQAKSWPAQDRQRYNTILGQCDYETLVQHHYDSGCMMRRNRYMVDHAALVISIYDGMPKGGTARTLVYAMKQGVAVDILEL